MYRHDVCHTGQSPNLGPAVRGRGRRLPGTPGATDVKIWHGFDKLRTSPSLSADGKTVYFGMGFDFCSVDAATMTTNECRLLHADVSDSSPAVAANGKVYMGDRDNSLNASHQSTRTAHSTLVWTYNHGFEGDIWQNPVIAPAGCRQRARSTSPTTRATDGAGIFTALIDSGTSPTVKWKYKIGNFVRQSSPAIDAERHHLLRRSERLCLRLRGQGSLYGQWHASHAAGAELLVHQRSQGGPVLLWRKQVGTTPGITASPVISADSNTLYIGTTGAMARHPHGPHRDRHLQSVSGALPAASGPVDVPDHRQGGPDARPRA